MENANRVHLFDPYDGALGNRGDGRHAQWLPGEATLAKEVPSSQHRNDRLLALLGNNCALDLPFLDVEDSLCRVALRENLLVFRVVCMRLSFSDLGQKGFGIENWRSDTRVAPCGRGLRSIMVRSVLLVFGDTSTH